MLENVLKGCLVERAWRPSQFSWWPNPQRSSAVEQLCRRWFRKIILPYRINNFSKLYHQSWGQVRLRAGKASPGWVSITENHHLLKKTGIKYLTECHPTPKVMPAFLGSFQGGGRKDPQFSSFEQSLERCYLETTLLIFPEDSSGFLFLQPAVLWMDPGLASASLSCLCFPLLICSSGDQAQDSTHDR